MRANKPSRRHEAASWTWDSRSEVVGSCRQAIPKRVGDERPDAASQMPPRDSRPIHAGRGGARGNSLLPDLMTTEASPQSRVSRATSGSSLVEECLARARRFMRRIRRRPPSDRPRCSRLPVRAIDPIAGGSARLDLPTTTVDPGGLTGVAQLGRSEHGRRGRRSASTGSEMSVRGTVPDRNLAMSLDDADSGSRPPRRNKPGSNPTKSRTGPGTEPSPRRSDRIRLAPPDRAAARGEGRRGKADRGREDTTSPRKGLAGTNGPLQAGKLGAALPVLPPIRDYLQPESITPGPVQPGEAIRRYRPGPGDRPNPGRDPSGFDFLEDAMAAEPRTISPMFFGMIKVAEAHGVASPDPEDARRRALRGPPATDPTGASRDDLPVVVLAIATAVIGLITSSCCRRSSPS